RALWGRLPHAETIDAQAIGRHVAALLLHGVGPAPASSGNAAEKAGKAGRKARRQQADQSNR
ncbi:TetR/AcrR family transcriptional regulator, partial [Ralstonia pseudosolanacearum]